MYTRPTLASLVCPETQQPLAEADDELVAQVNGAVAAGGVMNVAGASVEDQCSGAFVRKDGVILYPVVDGIAKLLVDEGIPLEQIKSINDESQMTKE